MHIYRKSSIRILLLSLLGISLVVLIFTLYGRTSAVKNDDLSRQKSAHFAPQKLIPIAGPINRINCDKLRKAYPIVDRVDGDMDIAFTIVVHKDIMQIARLLRMIYRKNNYYCIHPDKKSGEWFSNALKELAQCFGSNVEVVPREKQIVVQWGEVTALLPQFVCGEQALRRHSTWRYLINIVGQEFVLKTNLELIAALKALNGSNLVEGDLVGRYAFRTRGLNLPLNATWIKGSILGAFTREFIYETVLGDKVKSIRDFILRPKMIDIPDEFYFTTLNYNPHLKLPGSCRISPPPIWERGLGYVGKYVLWRDYGIYCPTKYVRSICILGEKHVEELQRVPHLVANKFHADYQTKAYDYLEDWYFSKVAVESLTGTYDKSNFDVTVFSKRICSRYHF